MHRFLIRYVLVLLVALCSTLTTMAEEEPESVTNTAESTPVEATEEESSEPQEVKGETEDAASEAGQEAPEPADNTVEAEDAVEDAQPGTEEDETIEEDVVSSDDTGSRWMLSLQAGTGQASLTTTRLSFQRRWSTTWWEEGKWFLGGYTDYAVGHWWNDEELNTERFDREEQANEVTVVSFSPVYRLERHEPLWGSTYPYIDFGIGVAWLSESNIENSHELSRDLGGDFQFEDRFGIGGRFGKDKRKEFGYTLIHYSNAGYDDVNTGITLHFLRYAFSF